MRLHFLFNGAGGGGRPSARMKSSEFSIVGRGLAPADINEKQNAHTNGLPTVALQQYPSAPLCLKNSSPYCFSLRQTLSGSTPVQTKNKEETQPCGYISSLMVPVAGVEPARYRYQRILSPPRLPIPTHRHGVARTIISLLF